MKSGPINVYTVILACAALFAVTAIIFVCAKADENLKLDPFQMLQGKNLPYKAPAAGAAQQ